MNWFRTNSGRIPPKRLHNIEYGIYGKLGIILNLPLVHVIRMNRFISVHRRRRRLRLRRRRRLRLRFQSNLISIFIETRTSVLNRLK